MIVVILLTKLSTVISEATYMGSLSNVVQTDVRAWEAWMSPETRKHDYASCLLPPPPIYLLLLKFIIPLMLVFITARTVGNRFNDGIYDTQIRVKKMPFLEQVL